MREGRVSEELHRRKRQLYLYYLLPLGIAFILICLLAIALVSDAYTYEPISIYDIRIEPSAVCPGKPVEVYVTQSKEAGIETLRIEEDWTTVDVEGIPPSRIVDVNQAVILEPPPNTKREVLSPALKEAPDIPGVFSVTVFATVESVQPFRPLYRTQFESDNRLTVLKPDDPMCKEEAS